MAMKRVLTIRSMPRAARRQRRRILWRRNRTASRGGGFVAVLRDDFGAGGAIGVSDDLGFCDGVARFVELRVQTQRVIYAIA